MNKLYGREYIPKTANNGQKGDLIPRPILFVSLKIDPVVKKCKGSILNSWIAGSSFLP